VSPQDYIVLHVRDLIMSGLETNIAFEFSYAASVLPTVVCPAVEAA
jgi:hypothetical protein